MIALGIVGASGSGKTTLLTALIRIFRARGFSVSSIKHAHHTLTFDRPGKDSFLHAEAGSQEVILASDTGFALFSQGAQPGPAELLKRLAPVDLVFVEGFKSYDMPKLEVYRAICGQPPLWEAMDVLAVASDAALPACAVPVLALDKPEAIADFLMSALGLNAMISVRE
jgi:molybdopterin-guanine dinucleotide biosynthesis protein B